MTKPVDPHNTVAALELLECGTLERAHGLLPWGSNYTFLMDVRYGGSVGLAVYKPRRGERPLWDFPDGTLCQREVAAFLVSEALGWHIVPPTTLRDGPQGAGMVQLFIEHDPEQHYFTFEKKQLPQLRVISLFDHVINNADRKGGHCLLDIEGRLWAIDHGVCFHMQPKLRTVIWDFASTEIPDDLLNDLTVFQTAIISKQLEPALWKLLTEREISAMCERADRLVTTRKFPEPGPGRQYPWPPV